MSDTPRIKGCTEELDVDVVVVGAGPAGLTSALLLARRGHEVALIDKYPEPYGLPRAVGINHETLRALQTVGAMDAVLPDLYISADGGREMEICSADGEVLIVRHDRGTSLSGWPERASFSQPEFEGTLGRQALDDPRITLLRGWRVTDVVDTGPGVVVDATPWPAPAADAVRHLRVSARYVLGCDGAHSVVRAGELDVVTDLGFSFDWLVVDVIPDEERSYTPNLGFILGPPRPTTSVSGGPGRRRWEFMRLDGETMEGLNRPETAWRLLEPFGMTPDNATLERHSVYSFRGRWSATLRSGRAVLVGDSAHLMPPFLGEGFNSAVRDAMAAAWRIDLILRGYASDSLLDSYSTERIGHVRQIVEQAVALGRILCVTDPQEAEARDAKLRTGIGGQSLATSEQGWRLGDGVWVADDDNAGRLGIQGRVTVAGSTGLFDDMVGSGFVLLGALADPGAELSDSQQKAWARIGGITAHLGADSPLADVDGTYQEWFNRLGAQVILIRPDFYVFGTTTQASGAAGLVERLLDVLGATDT